MRVTLILIFLVGFASCLFANELKWHKGSVVFADRHVVVGEIARQSFDLLLFRNEHGNVSALPAHKIQSFRYYDEKENVNRAFVTILNKYYERVVFGRISVLRIQKFFDQDVNEKHQNQFDYFIVENKSVYNLGSFRKKFFERIKEELDLRLVSYGQFDPNTKKGAVSLILLYNRSLETWSI